MYVMQKTLRQENEKKLLTKFTTWKSLSDCKFYSYTHPTNSKFISHLSNLYFDMKAHLNKSFAHRSRIHTILSYICVLTFDISIFSKGLLQKLPRDDESYSQQRQHNSCHFFFFFLGNILIFGYIFGCITNSIISLLQSSNCGITV